ncbi:MAG: helix-turn-helix domain-containing protein [Ruminococcus sp.]|nr:helix-turn-helix domain-containing protein [Ruminococcus sp.]
MQFEEKLKAARKEQGLKQEEIAVKLCVSRAAVAKWESGKGMPDLENLKAIATLLDVSVDYLLGEASDLSMNIVKEPICWEDYPVHNRLKTLKENIIVMARYPDATITTLRRKRKLSLGEKLVDGALFLLTDAPPSMKLADQWKDLSAYYLVELSDKTLLVNVTKEFLISRRICVSIAEKKIEIGENVFTKCERIQEAGTDQEG